MIYEQVFFEPSGAGKEASDILVPLLTCRRFYNEAVRTAFSSVTFHLNWYNIAEKYYDGAWYESEDSPRVEIESRMNGIVVERRIEPPATRDPVEFNVMSIATRAGLSDAHLGAIRRLSITSFMDLSRAGDWALWTLFHFLKGLESMKKRDFQLDTLIIKTPLESDWPASFELTTDLLRSQYNAVLSALWRRRITKRIIVDNTAVVTGIGLARSVYPQWFSAHHSHRMYCIGHDLMEKYAEDVAPTYLEDKNGSLDLDDVDNLAGWEFFFQKHMHWPGKVNYIDITRRNREVRKK